MTTTITGVFQTRELAETAIGALEDGGFTSDQISLVLTDDARTAHFGLRESSKVDEGVGAGAGVGGVIGAVAAAVFAAGTIAIPGLNLVVAGALFPALAGLGAGAFTGGLIGGLIGAGIPEHEARIYDDAVKAGHVLVAARATTTEQKSLAERILKDGGTRIAG